MLSGGGRGRRAGVAGVALASIALAATLAACDGGPAAPPSLAGRYPLVAVDHRPLPYTGRDPIPIEDGGDGVCRPLLSSGHLLLDDDATFELVYEQLNACTRALWAVSRIAGAWSVEGEFLVFTVPPTGGEPEWAFIGTDLGVVLEVRLFDRALEFARL